MWDGRTCFFHRCSQTLNKSRSTFKRDISCLAWKWFRISCRIAYDIRIVRGLPSLDNIEISERTSWSSEILIPDFSVQGTQGRAWFGFSVINDLDWFNFKADYCEHLVESRTNASRLRSPHVKSSVARYPLYTNKQDFYTNFLKQLSYQAFLPTPPSF